MSEFTSEDSPTKKKRRTKFKEVSSTLSKEEVIRRLKVLCNICFVKYCFYFID